MIHEQTAIEKFVIPQLLHIVLRLPVLQKGIVLLHANSFKSDSLLWNDHL